MAVIPSREKFTLTQFFYACKSPSYPPTGRRDIKNQQKRNPAILEVPTHGVNFVSLNSPRTLSLSRHNCDHVSRLFRS